MLHAKFQDHRFVGSGNEGLYMGVAAILVM